MAASSLLFSLPSPSFSFPTRHPHSRLLATTKSSLSSRNNTSPPSPPTKDDSQPTTTISSTSSTSSSVHSWVSPDWLTSLVRSLSTHDDSNIPVANAKLEDVSDLLGGALFLPLFKLMTESGPVYRLAAGPRNFVVVSDPAVAKHVLRNYGKYAKGLVSEISEFLFGSGFATAEGALWTVLSLLLLLSMSLYLFYKDSNGQ